MFNLLLVLLVFGFISHNKNQKMKTISDNDFQLVESDYEFNYQPVFFMKRIKDLINLN